MVKALKVDVVIIGGGLVGGTLGIALAQEGISVAVIDRESPDELLKPDLDGRTTAVTYGSKLFFEHLNVWEKFEHSAEPILTIRVFERDSPWAIYYNHTDVGNVPMGYIVENKVLRQGIFQRASELKEHLHWMAPLEVIKKERNLNKNLLYLADEKIIEASLLIGAEGRFSPSRTDAGIKTYGWKYQQMALIAHVCHEKPHEGSAWEIFQPQGPFAILPLRKCPSKGENRSGIVWTGSAEEIKRLEQLDDAAITHELEEIFPYFGKMSLSGKRWTYPLSAMIAKTIIDHRFAIVGDAAHTIHPVAGQGVNLGWRDVEVLAEVLKGAKSLGLDIGTQSVLQDYQRRRRLDTASVLALCDGMVRLFSNESKILSFLRNTGLGIVNQLPPLKRQLMRRAMGI
ncbi:MAG: 2-octaprenyl-6-methoxyphenyl hydroxylase [Alphaproteobacteria bacterium]|nr:2-octaprenyl-6-methoxyphenyl hydroxylase [Alphaproteobacteria bacterium]